MTLFSAFSLGALRLANRLVMAPMQQYCGTIEGHAIERHVEHYARRAAGGVGLVIVEATSVSPEGRLMLDDLSLFDDSQIAGLSRIVSGVHAHGVPVAAQLVHGGRKSVAFRGSSPIGPGTLAYSEKFTAPRAMTVHEIERVKDDFVLAARRAVRAGFDAIELHAAHGFLLHQFLSPLTNTREDAWGGNADRRARLLHEVVRAVHGVLPLGMPLTVRISASDYAEGGLEPKTVGEALRGIERGRLAAVHVSSGGLLPVQPPSTDEGYQVPFAAEIRALTGLPTIAVGQIRSAERASDFLRTGACDLVAIGRPLLEDPDLPRRWRASAQAQSELSLQR